MSNFQKNSIYERTDISVDQLKINQQKLKEKYGSENPCAKEQELSLKCLEDNNYDKNLCVIYFDNYKGCKSFWLAVQTQRKEQNIQPSLPNFEEREKIKAEYLKNR